MNFNTIEKNPCYKFMTIFVELLWLSILWIVCAIPIVTMGAATTGVYYAINKAVRHERGYVTQVFFYGFKSNFKKATGIWLISLAIFLLLMGDISITRSLIGGMKGSILLSISVLLLLMLTGWNLYVFPFVARFENTWKESMGYAGRIALAEILYTLLLIVIFGGILAVTIFFPPTIVLTPGVYLYIACYILESRFQRYMSDADLKAEEQRNRCY